MLLKQEELNELLLASKEQTIVAQKNLTSTIDRIKLLESTVDGAIAEKRALEQQISEMKEQMDNDHVELDSIRTLYENERAKVYKDFLAGNFPQQYSPI